MVKFLWDKCIPHDFIRYIYKQDNYTEISKPNLTYQKANSIVKNIISEDLNQINLLKYEIEERFSLIRYIHSKLFSKIYNKTDNFAIQNKKNFISIFKLGKIEKLLKQLVEKF